MIEISVRELQNRSINTMIDENVRFTISQEDDIKEEERRRDVTDRVALLREEYLRGTK